MFQHILVPVDFTEKNRRALDIAINLAQIGAGTVSMLHVIELIVDTPVEEFQTFYATLEEQATQKIQALVAQYTGGLNSDKPVQLEPKITYGNRVQEIIRFAEEQSVDLIVINSHKIEWNEPTQGLGTISYKVSILADCPVLLIK